MSISLYRIVQHVASSTKSFVVTVGITRGAAHAGYFLTKQNEPMLTNKLCKKEDVELTFRSKTDKALMEKTGKKFKQERTRIYDDKRTDVYRSTKKLREPTICQNCGALFVNGRWTWDDIPPDVYQGYCPACQRTNDRYPAGIIEISGSFFRDHHTQIINMIKNIHSNEISEHPLERIMDIKKKREKTIITTTGTHLARRIGDALYSAYEGELDYNYEEEHLIRVFWKR